MKDLKNRLAVHGWWMALLAAWILILLSGCYGTVTPKTVTTSAASWDAGQQNSGLVCWSTNAQGRVVGAVLTPHAVARYNELMATYGDRWKPAVKPGDGISDREDGNYTIDAQHFAYFGIANHWRKQGTK